MVSLGMLVNIALRSTTLMNDQNVGKSVTASGPTKKFITLNYHSDGNIEMDSNAMGCFDLWSAARLIQLKGDEIYINAQTQMRLAAAAKNES
jgi:hypothetical protein